MRHMQVSAVFCALISVLLPLSGCGDSSTPTSPPTPTVPASPPAALMQINGPQPALAGAVPLTFTASGSGAGNITFAWDFGDGSSATGVSATHTYAAGGTFTVALSATGAGGTTTVTGTVIVKDLTAFWTGGVSGLTQGLILEQSGASITGFPTTGIDICGGRLDGTVSAPNVVRLNIFFNSATTCFLGTETYVATLDTDLDVMTGLYSIAGNSFTTSFRRQAP